MKLDEVLDSARETITVRRVFADPYEKDGLTVIAGARLSGGAGGGGGHDQQGQEGSGGGFGVNARPAGAFVIRDGKVRWQPAVDVTRLALVAGAVAVALLLARGRRTRSGRLPRLSRLPLRRRLRG
jgi:uncharacterized spore protein YtfJ